MGILMSGNVQHLMCSNAECRNQRPTIKHCLEEFTQWKANKIKYNIPKKIEKLLKKNCKIDEVRYRTF